MRGGALVAAVLFAASAPALAGEAPGEMVLVWRDAPLRDAADEEAPWVRVSRPLARNAPRSDMFLPMRWVRDAGDFVEVETVEAPPDGSVHCYAGHLGLDPLKLRMFVKREDLAPVTTRPLILLDAIGRVSLPAGIAVPTAGPRFTTVDGFALTLPVPPDAIGTRYQPTPQFDVSTPVGEVKGALRLPGQKRAEGKPPPVFAQRKAARGVEAILRTRCAEFAVVVPSVRAVSANSEIGALGGVVNDPRFSARAGATVRWLDGRVAGTVRSKLLLRAPFRDEPLRACFRVVFDDGRDDGALSLCFDRRDLSIVR